MYCNSEITEQDGALAPTPTYDANHSFKHTTASADAVMRLRAEYLFEQKSYGEISFNFTNRFECDYPNFANGTRVAINDNSCEGVKTGSRDFSYETFRKYLKLAFSYADTQSLQAQMKSIGLEQLTPGNVFIRTGNPYGHTVIVRNMASKHTNSRYGFSLVTKLYARAKHSYFKQSFKQSFAMVQLKIP